MESKINIQPFPVILEPEAKKVFMHFQPPRSHAFLRLNKVEDESILKIDHSICSGKSGLLHIQFLIMVIVNKNFPGSIQPRPHEITSLRTARTPFSAYGKCGDSN